MVTLSEFLKTEENQSLVLNKIIELFRERGEWGSRGLFTKISGETCFSAAYVGQVLKGKKPITGNFLVSLAIFLEVDVDLLWERPLRVETKTQKEADADAEAELSKLYRDQIMDQISLFFPNAEERLKFIKTSKIKLQKNPDGGCTIIWTTDMKKINKK